MRETAGTYLQRRYRLALVGLVLGALMLIAAPAGTLGVELQIVGAVVIASALVIAARTRCPKCAHQFDTRVIAALVEYSRAPPKRCPHCGVDLGVSRN